MVASIIACARCAGGNHPSERFCTACGLPLGAAQADIGAVLDALGPYEAPDPDDPDVEAVLRELVSDCGFEAAPFGPGWRVVVPLELDRRQAVYIGPGGFEPEGGALLSLVSVCGPANDRDARVLLKWNARAVEGHFAIRVLRGEEYFVVVRNLPADLAVGAGAGSLVRRIAVTADGLEDRLSRGRDLY